MIHVCCTLFAVNIPIWSDMKLQKMIIGASCCFMKHVTFSSFMSNINTSIHQAYWSYICTYTNLLQALCIFLFASPWYKIFQSVNLRTGQFYMAVMFPQLDVKTGIQINKHSLWDTSLGHARLKISFSFSDIFAYLMFVIFGTPPYFSTCLIL